MNLVNYYDLDKQQYNAFVGFLKECSTETDQPAHKNMYDLNWEQKNNTLLYILEKTDRFRTNGAFTILFDNLAVLACSGVYRSNFCDDFAIAGTRTWIHKNYRNKQIPREILLPHEKAWAIKNSYKAIGLCFNDYNKNIIEIFYRKRLGETRTKRDKHHMFYNGVNKLDYPIIIQHTKQWVIYEVLNDSFNFDWSTLLCK